MNENDMAGQERMPMRSDEQRFQRSGCRRFAGCFIQQRIGEYKHGGVASTLMARDYKSAKDMIVEDNAVQNSSGNGISGTLDSHYYKGAGEREGTEREFVAIKKDVNARRKYIVRRLTPTECARLQGFPDWWCDGADGSDSAQYKLWGNGIALPCAADVISRIVRAIERGW